MAKSFDVGAVRQHFPALEKQQIYFDNAGGSQVLEEVVISVSDYLLSSNVQLGASYPISKKSTNLFDEGKEAATKYVNASPGEVVLGASTTQLFRNLSLALWEHLSPGSEIILSKLDHEANVAPWLQLAQWRGLTIKWWGSVDKQNPTLDCEVLRSLLSEQTKLVACTHSSNILGQISDIKRIAQTVHTVPGALLCVDGVAYAPHRPIDVKELEVDVYCFSWYKVYGPHIAMLYARKSIQPRLQTLGHYFHGVASLSDMLGLSASNYEMTSSIPAVCKYLSEISWDSIAKHEEKIQGILIDYLNSRKDVQIWGEKVADFKKRVPVISFTVAGHSSQSVVEAVEAKSNFGFRWGSFYSNRLVQEVMGLDPLDGVIRVSMVHYNTEEEVREFINVLDETLESQ